jgi:predicted ATPase
MTSNEVNLVEPVHGKFHVITGANGTGKTRYLSSLSAKILSELDRGAGEYSRMLCLSGTVYDKFPRVKIEERVNDRYIYLGNKTNNNMFSEISPFRNLSTHLLSDRADNQERSGLAQRILETIGFENTLKLKFRRARNTVDATLASAGLELQISLGENYRIGDIESLRREQIEDSKIHLSGITVIKGGAPYELEELSSGERLYLLVVLGICFCTENNSLILFDEPENSLHPKWQTKLIQDINLVVREISDNSTIVIATHSPLIVSSAPNVDSFIRNLPTQDGWLDFEFFGRNSDAILESQFGLLSPRSLTVMSSVQNCLSALTMVQSDPQIFLNAVSVLDSLEINFEAEDPLYTTVKEIFAIRRAMQ